MLHLSQLGEKHLYCKIDTCGKTKGTRGWCEPHYRAWLKHGDPLLLQPRPQKGIKRPASVGVKISASKIGSKYPSFKFNPKSIRRGQDHHNWQGGIAKADKLERNRFQKEISPVVLKRDDYTCAFCAQHGGKLHVDHIKSWSLHPELRFDTNNCRTLCVPCHYYITFKRKIPQNSGWGMNKKGMVLS